MTIVRLFHGIQAYVFIFSLSACAQAMAQRGENESWISFPKGDKALSGFLSRPRGNGPFKTMIFNHGSERNPRARRQLAAFYNRNGFVFFMPYRTGHGRSPGMDIRDKLAAIRGTAGFRQKQVGLLEDDNQDVEAAVQWLKAQPFVNRNQIAMSGSSFGGIQTLLTAEKGFGIKAFIAFTPATMSWRNHLLRRRLLTAVARAKAPVFLILAANDFSTGPYEILGPEIRAQDPLNRAKLYPAFGSTKLDAHVVFPNRTQGIKIWGPDVIAFLQTVWTRK